MIKIVLKKRKSLKNLKSGSFVDGYRYVRLNKSGKKVLHDRRKNPVRGHFYGKDRLERKKLPKKKKR